MNYKISHKNFTIHRNKKIPNELIKTFTKAHLINKNLFGKNILKFNIYLCDNEKEFKKESKYYYFPHAAGTVLRDSTIVIKTPEFLKRSKKEYQGLITHEMNHSFSIFLFKTQKPIWIHEGLANLIQNKLYINKKELIKILRNKNEEILKYRYLKRDFDSIEKIKLNYSTWFLFLKFITKNQPRKIVQLMNEFSRNPSKKNYDKLFIKFFEKNLKNKFKEFRQKI
jgi:hypothetical protein